MSESTELQRAVERLTSSIEQLRTELVRKDVYESDQRGIESRVTGLADDHRELKVVVEKAEEKRAADRRLIMFSLVVPLLLVLLQLYVAAQGGGGK